MNNDKWTFDGGAILCNGAPVIFSHKVLEQIAAEHNELAALREANQELVAALKPFADVDQGHLENPNDLTLNIGFTVDEFWKAKQALEKHAKAN